MKKSALVTLLLGVVAIASEAGDKISSYRPYPYVFLHGRWSTGEQWGMNCSQGKDLTTEQPLLHKPEPNFTNVSTCRMFDKFWGRRGYAESFYNEFFRPHECDKSYRTDPSTGLPVEPRFSGDMPRINYVDGPNGTPRFPPRSCTNEEFYADFQQMNPSARSEAELRALPADSLPQYDPTIGNFWGKTLLGGNKLEYTEADKAQLLSLLPHNDLDKVSFNHAYIEAYNGDGNREKADDREVLSEKHQKTTLVQIAQQRIKEVLDEYYVDENNKPNWACDPSKKVILVGYSTGMAVAGGVIYHDQKLLKEGKNIASWCHGDEPTEGNEENARDLLSQHIAYVVGHNPVVAGSHYAPGQTVGNFVIYGSLPVWLPAMSYLAVRTTNWGLWATLGLGAALEGSVFLTQLLITPDRLAADLGWHSDYNSTLRRYGVPPQNALTGEKIKYKTVATQDWAWNHSIDIGMMIFATTTIAGGVLTGNTDLVVAGGIAVAGLTNWMTWNHGTDVVLEAHESVTSGKALHKDAEIEFATVSNAAHTGVAVSPAAYPYHPEVWSKLRTFLFEKPKVSSSTLFLHKCVDHAGDAQQDCDVYRSAAGQSPLDVNGSVNRTTFYKTMADWLDDAGNSQQTVLELASRPKNEVIHVNDGGGAPLVWELLYNSNLMASDEVRAYVNGVPFPLRFRKEFGVRTEPGTHSAYVQIPLTVSQEQGRDFGIPDIWGNLASGLRSGGNIIKFRGTNPAGTAEDRRVIYFDNLLVSVNSNPDIYVPGQTGIGADNLNLHTFRYVEGAGNAAIREVDPVKGVLFAFQTNTLPQEVTVKVFGTKNGEELDKDRSVTYLIDRASMPGSGAEKYNPYPNSIPSGKVFLTRKLNTQVPQPDAHQFFFWIKPQDLKMNAGGVLEGLKHVLVQVEKSPVGSETETNKTYYQLEFTVDNTAPANLKVLGPTLAARIGSKSYADEDGDGTLTKEIAEACGDGAGRACDPGRDGLDNDGIKSADNVEELNDIRRYSQRKNAKGERLSVGIPIRVSLEDNLQAANPFAKSLQWGIKREADGQDIFTSGLEGYIFGTVFHGFYSLPDFETTPFQDGLYSVWVRVLDQAGNAFEGTITQIILDNTPPALAPVSNPGENWKGNVSMVSGSIFQKDAFASTQVTLNEQANIEIRLSPQGGSGVFVVNSSLSPDILNYLPPAHGLQLMIYDNLDFLQLRGTVTAENERLYKKLPDGKYTIEVFATDKVGNSTAIPSLGTSGATFVVDRTPLALPQMSVSPFLISEQAMQQGTPTLALTVSRELDAASNKIPEYELKIFLDGAPTEYSQVNTFAHLVDKEILSLPFSTLLTAARRQALSAGQHVLTAEAREKDGSVYRNVVLGSAPFVYKNWDIAITRPEKGNTVTGSLPIVGRVSDPDIQDNSPFHHYRLSYAVGHFEDNPGSLPATRPVTGLMAMGSQGPEGTAEAPQGAVLGSWDSRAAITGTQNVTLVLEAFDARGQSVRALRNIVVDNTQPDPQPTTTLEFTAATPTGDGKAVDAEFELTGKSSQVVLSVFNADGNLVNRLEALSAPHGFDAAYLPATDQAVLGSDGTNLIIRFSPGNAHKFAFLLKGLSTTVPAYEVGFYDASGAKLPDAPPPQFLKVADGALQYSPTEKGLPEATHTVEVTIPLDQLANPVRISFANSLFDLLHPEKGVSGSIPVSAILMGEGRYPVTSNPFNFNSQPFLRWNLSNSLGEEVPSGDYTLQLEGYTQDRSEYLAATPLRRTFTKQGDPALKIANARLGQTPITPLLADGKVRMGVPLAFSVSQSAYVTVNVFKVGQVVPIRQTADKVLVAGGYDRIVDFLGWNEEYGMGDITLEPGSKYFFEITAVSRENPDNACTVSPDDAACYDFAAGEPMRLEFEIAKPSQARIWDNLEFAPLVLTSKTTDPIPATTAPVMNVQPVAPVAWKVTAANGAFHPPVTVKYEVKKKGKRNGIQVGYHLTLTSDPNTEWNYVGYADKHFRRNDGGNQRRNRFLAVKKNWGLGKTVSFYGPSFWHTPLGNVNYQTDQVWNGQNPDANGSLEQPILGKCGINPGEHYYVPNSTCAYIPGINPPQDRNYTFPLFENLFPHDPGYTPGKPYPSWIVEAGGPGEVVQVGHWNTAALNGEQYSEMGVRFLSTANGGSPLLGYYRVGLAMRQIREVTEYSSSIVPPDNQDVLLPNVAQVVTMQGAIQSLMHQRIRDRREIRESMISNPTQGNTFRFDDLPLSSDPSPTFAGELKDLSDGDGPWFCCHKFGYRNDYDLMDLGFTANARDYFDLTGEIRVKAGGQTVDIPIDIQVRKDNQAAYLGTETSTPSEYLLLHNTAVSLTSQLGPCAGYLHFAIYWKSDRDPYQIEWNWKPSTHLPGCADGIAEKVASREGTVHLNVSPNVVGSAPNPIFTPYSAYLNTNAARTAENPVDFDGAIASMLQNELNGYTPVNFEDGKPFQIEIKEVKARLNAGQEETQAPGIVEFLGGEVGGHSSGTFRIHQANVNLISREFPFDTRRQAATDWGAFAPVQMPDPVDFDSWNESELRAGFCQSLTPQGACATPVEDAPGAATSRLFRREGGSFVRNLDVRLNRLRADLLDARAESNHDVELRPTSIWVKNQVEGGYDLASSLHNVQDAVPLSLTVKTGAFSPKRFLAEQEDPRGLRSILQPLASSLSSNAGLLPVRDKVTSAQLAPLAFNIGNTAGPLLHRVDYFDPANPADVTGVDLKSYKVGTLLNFAETPSPWIVSSPHKRISAQFQAPPVSVGAAMVAEVVPVNLNELALQLPSGRIPYLDNPVAPAFILYPEVQAYEPGNEPTLTYFLRRDEVTVAGHPERSVSSGNLIKLFALSPSTGKITDITAYITLMERNPGAPGLTATSCMQSDAGTSLPVPDGLAQCLSFTDFGQQLDNSDWEYLKLTAQPRFLSEEPPPAAPFALAATASVDFHHLAYVPTFEASVTAVAISLQSQVETATDDITLTGFLVDLDGNPLPFADYRIDFGHGPSALFQSYQQMEEGGRIASVVTDDEGMFTLTLENLATGSNTLFARIGQAGPGGGAIPGVHKTTIRYFTEIPPLDKRVDPLVSNSLRPEIRFEILSQVSGALEVNVFNAQGTIIKTLTGEAIAGNWTSLPWDPSTSAEVGLKTKLTYVATVVAPTGAVGLPVTGTVQVDYLSPRVEITRVSYTLDDVVFHGQCVDEDGTTPLPTCHIRVSPVLNGGEIAFDPLLAGHGEFRHTIPVVELAEHIEPGAVFHLLIDGADAAGNRVFDRATSRLDAQSQPRLSPPDLSFVSRAFTPAVEKPEFAAGILHAFHQGALSNLSGSISSEENHLVTALMSSNDRSQVPGLSNVIVDRTPPVLSASNLPAEGAVVTSPFILRANASDQYLKRGVLSVVSGHDSKVLSMAHSDQTLETAVDRFGHYRVRLLAEDMAGNTTEIVRNFQYDRGGAEVYTDIGENDFVPVVNREAHIYWSVVEDHGTFEKNTTAEINGRQQPVIYTDFLGRIGSTSRFLSRIPVGPQESGAGSVHLMAVAAGEPGIDLHRSFRFTQAPPTLVSANPPDGAYVPRQFGATYRLHSDAGLAEAELTLPDGTKVSSGPLNGSTDYDLAAQVDYQGTPLDIALRLVARDRVGNVLDRTINYSVFDLRVMMKDNAMSDARLAKPQIKLVNNTPQPLSGFTVRLWLSRQEIPWADVAVDPYVTDPCGIRIKTSVHAANANLLKVDFKYPSTYQLLPGAQTPENGLQAGLHFLDRASGNWNKADDWSWQGIGASFQATRYVTVYNSAGLLIYGQEPNVQAIPQPPAAPTPSGFTRLGSSLQALYLFHEGFGSEAADISAAGIPLDLKLTGANARWMPTGGLDLTAPNHNAILENRTANRKLFAASVLSGQVGIEAWVEPSNLTQDLARIVEYGSASGAFEWNWGMVQKGRNLEFRLRTANGAAIMLATTNNPLASANARYHVVMSYKPYNSSSGEGGMRIFVNGNQVASNQESGALNGSGTNAWNPGYILSVGNHAVALDRDWQGKVNLIAVYARGLSPAEVARNFNAGVQEPPLPSEIRLGVACGDRVLPADIVDGYRGWQDDRTADNRTLTMSGLAFGSGIGGQPQNNGAPAWMAYDLTAERNRLELGGEALRLTGFGGKQDGSGPVSVFVKTSPNATQPSDNDWLNNAGGVVQRFFTTDATNVPLDIDLRHAKWLMVGTKAAQSGTNLHGVFGGIKVRFGTVPAPKFAPKVVYRYHEVASLAQLPAFDTMTPMKTGLVDRFEVTPRLRGDLFAFEYAGFLNVTTAGTYTFFTNSDDGSRLYVDGKLVVDNDCVHAVQERSGQLTLTAGYHAIKVQYWDNGGGDLLEVRYQGPGIGKQIIPAGALFHSESYDYGVEADYFEGSWDNLPSFEAMTPAKTETRNKFRIAPHALPDGFGYTFESDVFLPVTGDYTFFTSSDDGSQLFVDGRLVANNDGIHPMQERSGILNLAAGFHSIRVAYFDKSGGEGLEVKIQGPGMPKMEIPVELLFTNGSQASNPVPSGKAGAIVMEGQSVDRNYTISGTQWFRIPLSNYANNWAGRIFVSLDDMDLRPMVGTFKFENGANQAIDGWYKSYVTAYTHQNELFFSLDLPERRTYKVRWWFEP